MKVPLSDLDYGAEESAAVQRVLQGKWLSMGPETSAFEEEFAAFLGVKHAIAVANGTAALHLALRALGLGPGDAVIQPAVNFVAAANMTLAVGATPAFADVCALAEPTIAPAAIGALLAPRHAAPAPPRPRALVVMHYGGYLCRMTEILELCRQHGLLLIEDACHAVGAAGALPAGPVAAGAFGDVGCFSFFSNKNMATGEGGMVTTQRDDVAEQIRRLRSHGMTSLTWERHRGHAASYDVLDHGYNYRLDDLRAALGRAQLKKLPRNNERRRELTRLYWAKLAPLEPLGWTLPFKDQAGVLGPTSVASAPVAGGNATPPLLPACHLLPVVAPDAATRWRCAEALKAAGIQTSLHYPLIPAFAAFAAESAPANLPNTREFCARILTLPLYPTLAVEAVDYVVEQLLAAAD